MMQQADVWVCFICDDTPHFRTKDEFEAHMQWHEEGEKRACDTLH